MPEIAIDTFLKGLSAGVSLAFSLVLILAGPRDRATRWLAAFLLALAGNQTAETIASWVHFAGGDNTAWFHVATVFAALDPLLLYLFAAHFPEPNALRRPAFLALVCAGSAAMLLMSLFMEPPFTYNPLGEDVNAMHALRFMLLSLAPLALALYTAAVYTIVLVHNARRLVGASPPTSAILLHVALCIAAFWPWRVALGQARWMATGVLRLFGLELVFVAEAAWSVLDALVVVAAILGVSLALSRRVEAPSARRGLWWGATLACAHLLLWVTGNAWALGNALLGGPVERRFPLEGVVTTGAAIRWMAFGALASVVFLRRATEVPAPRRQAAARALIGLAVLAPFFLLLTIVQRSLGADELRLRPMDWVFLGGLTAASQGFRSFVDRVARGVYGIGAAPAPEPRALPDAPEPPLLPGAVVEGRYRVREFLGRGGAGRAFLAADERMLRDVVLKEVPEEGEEGARGLREARIAGSLHHPHVLTVYDVLTRPGASLLVCEYAPGGSLADRVAREGPLPTEEGVRLLEGVLDGLAAAHARGIIHRDLTPANVLLDARGAPRLADFGLAARSATMHLHGAPRPGEGTPGFMAPEQRDGGPVTPATDVYAAGLLFQRCVQPGARPEVAQVFARALRADPSARWTDAAQMHEALRRARAALRSGTA